MPNTPKIEEIFNLYRGDKTPSVPGGSTPRQYSFPKGLTEIQDLIEFREMNFALGNIFKACFRIGHCDHSDAKRELNKIIWFANRELKRLSNG